MIKEDKEVIIASSMLDGNRYFIYRDDGVEVQVDINGENYSHNKPITKPEYNKIKMMKKIRGKKQDKNIITNEPRYFQSKMNSEM